MSGICCIYIGIKTERTGLLYCLILSFFFFLNVNPELMIAFVPLKLGNIAKFLILGRNYFGCFLILPIFSGGAKEGSSILTLNS